MLEYIFPNKVQAKDSILTTNGKEIVFMIETFLNDTVIIRFISGRKLICYSKEILQVCKNIKSFSNCIEHKREFKI